MGIFSRIFKVGQSEAHSLVDKLENPIKMTEQGIRDLKSDLDKSLKAYAEVKSMLIRAKREASEYKEQAKNYEQKAILVLQKAQKGEMETAEADRLAGEALSRKSDLESNAERSVQDAQKLEQSTTSLKAKIDKLKSQITHYENELKTLKARAKVSKATQKINKSLSGIDSSSTVSMLEKMKDKVSRDEELAEAYGEMANESKGLDDELDSVLDDSDLKKSNDLEALKRKLNM